MRAARGWAHALVPALLALASLAPLPAQEVRIFEDPESWAHPEEVSLREQDLLFNEPFTQSFGSRAFHFIGRLDDGTQYVFIVFKWVSAFLGGWGMSVLVTEPDGSTFAYEERMPDDQVTVESERFHIRIQDSELDGADGRYRIRIRVEGFSCDLRVRNLLPLWRPGDGYVFLDARRDAYIRLGVNSPWAQTEGYLVVRGKWISGRGQCYGDRSLHNYPLGRTTASTVAFRGFSPAGAAPGERWFLSVLRYQTHQSYGSRYAHVLILAHDGQWVLTARNCTLRLEGFRSSGLSPYPYPARMVVEVERDGYRLEGAFRVRRVYHLSDIYQKLPPVFRAIVSLFFQRPVIYRVSGEFRGTLTRPDGSRQPLSLPGQGEYSVLR